jgi:multiple antibiotic resistance protein
MLEDIGLIKAIITLFIIIDPLGNIPIFITLTEGSNPKKRKRIYHTTTVVSFALLLVFTLLGKQILTIFGISLGAFMIAGGVLLLIISIKVIVFGERRAHVYSPDIGAVPMACPLLVGPGTIATTILLLQTTNLFITLIAVLVNFFIIWLVLKFVEPIYKFLGRVGAAVIARVLAIFLTAVAIGFITEGITSMLQMYQIL